MKLSTLVLSIVSFGAAIGAHNTPTAHAAEGSYLHRSTIASGFCIAGTCYSVDHTWAESLSSDAGCQNDEIESWNTHDPCTSNTSSGCTSLRGAYTAQWSASQACNRGMMQTCYANSPPGGYAYNGVCHQSSNRALSRTAVPWVSSLPIGGGDVSYNIFHYYGTSWPWGNWYTLPC